MDKKISLIIPAYNEEKMIGHCLEAVMKNAPGRFFEILVIDNASTDKTAEIAERFPNVRVVRENWKGLTRARERGRLEAKGDLLAYIDADTEIPPQWIEKVENFFATHPNAVSLSGPYHYPDASGLLSLSLKVSWWLLVPITYRIVGFMLIGGNFVAKKEALLKMGGFDTSIEFYGEDTNIARRLSAFGDVVFRMDFFINSSSRRFQKEGFFKTNITYVLNFFSEAFLKRPLHKKYQDIRIKKE